MIPTTIIILSIILILAVMMIRNHKIKQHLQSKHLLNVFESHGNHIQLNKAVSLTLDVYLHDGKKSEHTDSYLVNLIIDGETIDTARIDYVSFPLLSNHYPELKFDGPWHQLVVKQYIPFSKQFRKQTKELKDNKATQTQDKYRHIQEHFKQGS